MATRRRAVHILLLILGLFLLGTVTVLSSISYYLAIPELAYITDAELDPSHDSASQNSSQHLRTERVPRIIHQTWKSETLPDKWLNVSEGCRALMPDYKYMLWTDASSREFIAQNYRWFLDTFDSYPYAIQRADAIRYFVLYHYGGVYIDLDIGCLRRLDPLLIFPVVLPRTIPVGVSNDLMFAEKEHPFMAQTIHNLITFDHNWILNYPTVMFSTGPMFLSAQYGLYTSSRPLTPQLPGGEVRILPKTLYGKNADEEEAPDSFFTHYYGSSWHSDDAAFIGFLGEWGKALLWFGLVILIVSLIRLGYSSSKQRHYGFRSVGGYDVLLPRWVERNGRWHLDMGWLSLPGRTSFTPPSSALSARHPDAMLDDTSSIEDDVQLLPLSLPSSPLSDVSTDDGDVANPPIGAVRRLSRHVNSLFGSSQSTHRNRRRRGVLFFLPAFSTSTGGVALAGDDARSQPLASRPLSQRSFYRPDKQPTLIQRRGRLRFHIRGFLDRQISGSCTASL
ncbi:nucleotide-diphospho-sugar transferase [Russula earlei]|uniref:Nucleotide-diphospho-sugar transferase n=1 Tax=Russula earlei TaxID=71964 RepID=A0ACC0UKG6_9AGAM|nr:nucleotide-diphospho-sugar transferase [Russula earlei]